MPRPQAIPAGKATIRFEFAYDGGGLGKGGLGTLFVNDKKVAEGRIERTQPMIFSADETADVGEDDATPVTEEYKAYDNKFTGKILKVTVDVKEMGAGRRPRRPRPARKPLRRRRCRIKDAQEGKGEGSPGAKEVRASSSMKSSYTTIVSVMSSLHSCSNACGSTGHGPAGDTGSRVRPAPPPRSAESSFRRPLPNSAE